MPLGALLNYSARLALRDLIFRVGLIAGLGVGLLWAMNRPVPETPASCGDKNIDRIGRCVGDGLLANFLPYAIGLAVGLMCGAVGAALLARVLLPRCPVRAKAVAGAAETWIVARFPGRCAACAEAIKPGDRIRHSPARSVCNSCGS